MIYDAETTARLTAEAATVPARAAALSEALRSRTYRTDLAAEAAIHGGCRRLGTVSVAIAQVFEALPLTLEGLPATEQHETANLTLHAFLINEFGFIDNLAALWAEQKPVRKADGNPLPNARIGFSERCEEIRVSFSQGFRDYLVAREPWFAVMEEFRHNLAHRIPPYIPRFSTTDRARDDAIDHEIFEAARAHDFDRVAALEAEQAGLRRFEAVVTHSFWKNAPVLGLHPQLLVDFATIEEFGQRMIGELNAIAVAP